MFNLRRISLFKFYDILSLIRSDKKSAFHLIILVLACGLRVFCCSGNNKYLVLGVSVLNPYFSYTVAVRKRQRDPIGAIKHRQSRDTSSIGHKTQNDENKARKKNNNKTTQQRKLKRWATRIP